MSFHYVTEFAWLVEPEGMPLVEHETEGDNDEELADVSLSAGK